MPGEDYEYDTIEMDDVEVQIPRGTLFEDADPKSDNGLFVEADYEGIHGTQWTALAGYTEDPELAEQVSRQDEYIDWDEFFQDPPPKYAGSYGGDNAAPGGRDLGFYKEEKDPLVAQIISRIISKIGYYGGDESIVEYVGD